MPDTVEDTEGSDGTPSEDLEADIPMEGNGGSGKFGWIIGVLVSDAKSGSLLTWLGDCGLALVRITRHTSAHRSCRNPESDTYRNADENMPVWLNGPHLHDRPKCSCYCNECALSLIKKKRHKCISVVRYCQVQLLNAMGWLSTEQCVSEMSLSQS